MGEGAVYQRADGLWCASVELGRDPRTGRRRRKVVSAKTKGETLRRLADVRRTVDAGLPVTNARRSTADYLAWWLDEVLPGTVKDRTAASYRFIVDKYVTPHIGTVPIAKLAPGHVHRMLRELEKAGLSPRTQRYARAVLRRALRHAEQYGIVNRNVAALVDGPKGGGSRLDDAPTAQEARAILDAAAGGRLEAFAVLALSLGLRRGELLGLQWPDVDLETRSLTVNRTLQYMPGQGLVVSAPKTTASARTIRSPTAVQPRCGNTAPGKRPNASRPVRPGSTAATSSRRTRAHQSTRATCSAGGTASPRRRAWDAGDFTPRGTPPRR
jgi:integrase